MFGQFSIFRPLIFTMNKVLVTVLVILLVAGVFVDQGDAMLRAGRDRIENMLGPMDERREARTAKCGSNCFHRGMAVNNFTSIVNGRTYKGFHSQTRMLEPP